MLVLAGSVWEVLKSETAQRLWLQDAQHQKLILCAALNLD